MRRNALQKDIRRSIRRERKRLIALSLITMLGVTMLTGLRASCEDLRRSSDRFFDQQRLHDLCVVSTLGLTGDDVEALQTVSGVLRAEGAYAQQVRVDYGSSTAGAIVYTFTPDGLDLPYPTRGRLPERPDEIAVTVDYLNDTGKHIGDTLTITESIASPSKEETDTGTDLSDDVSGSSGDPEASEDPILPEFEEEEETAHFPVTEFTITGVVTDITNVINTEGSTASFRNNDSAGYPLFVLMEAVDTDLYTSVNLLVEGASELDTFSRPYRDLVKSVRDEIENTIKEDRQQARSRAIASQAGSKIEDAEAEVWAAFSDAQTQLDDARKELNSNWNRINSGTAELNLQEADANAQFASARQQIREQRSLLDDGKAQVDSAQAQLNDAREQLESFAVPLRSSVATAREALGGLTPDNPLYGPAQQALQELEGQLGSLEAQLADIVSNQALLDSKRAEIENGYAAIAAAEADLNAAEADAQAQFSAARAQLDGGRAQLYRGEQDYSAGLQEMEEQREMADQKLRDAWAVLDELDTAAWYVRDRSSLNGFADIQSDADCIQSIGTVFPILFLLIAVLIALTTITRMVEENRGLIGTYMALGFSSREIRRKYIRFSTRACVIGWILGNLAGYIVLPEIIFVIFRTMYLLPNFVLSFAPFFSGLGFLIFYLGIVGSTWFTCRKEFRYMPAVLMRPKAPGNGSRIFLEYIRPVWRHMSFLSKVTARNLFRYKKRFFMTVFGIAGCTGLLLCGFTIKDTVADLLPNQYSTIFAYDILAATQGGEDMEQLQWYLYESDDIHDYISVSVQPVQVTYGNDCLSMQMYVFPDGLSPRGYFTLYSPDGSSVRLSSDGFHITENAAIMLGFRPGDEIDVQTIQLDTAKGPVVSLVENYLGNAIYVTESFCRQAYGSFEPNAALMNLTDPELVYEVSDTLSELDGVLSVTSVQSMKDGFKAAFALMNLVVYVVIILAAALAFVVLFTLSTTNISERERELATIKVLGFHDREVHRYVNKESFLLTLFGILLGMPVGKLFGFTLMNSLRLNSICFVTSLHRVSYLYALVISVVFALLVEGMTNRILNRIDPIEALKSVE